MNKSYIPAIILGIVAMLAGFYLAIPDNHSGSDVKPPAIQGAIYPAAKALTAFTLKDHKGEVFNESDLKGQWNLVFVGYTHCPDICPTTMNVMGQVYEYMKNESTEPPRIIFLSIDPERDSVEKLNDYVSYFNNDFTGLTGSSNEVANLARQLNAVYQKAPGMSGKITNDDYLMDHSSALMLINPDGHLQSILTAPHLPGTIIESVLKSRSYFEFLHANS